MAVLQLAGKGDLAHQQRLLNEVRLAEVLAAIHRCTKVSVSYQSLVHGQQVQASWHWPQLYHRGTASFRYLGVETLARELARLWDGKVGCREGGLLWLVGLPGIFWSMVLNWHAHGTCLPLGGGGSNMTPLQFYWDSCVKNAAAASSSVDCMFFCTPVGCANGSGCTLRHDQQKRKLCQGRPPAPKQPVASAARATTAPASLTRPASWKEVREVASSSTAVMRSGADQHEALPPLQGHIPFKRFKGTPRSSTLDIPASPQTPPPVDFASVLKPVSPKEPPRTQPPSPRLRRAVVSVEPLRRSEWRLEDVYDPTILKLPQLERVRTSRLSA